MRRILHGTASSVQKREKPPNFGGFVAPDHNFDLLNYRLQFFELTSFQFERWVYISIQRYGNTRMSKQFTQRFCIHTRFNAPRRECVPQCVVIYVSESACVRGSAPASLVCPHADKTFTVGYHKLTAGALPPTAQNSAPPAVIR